MITIQRVRVRWTSATRGAPHANARRGLDRAAPLPAVRPTDGLFLQDVLLDETAGYEPSGRVVNGGLGLAGDAGLWLIVKDSTVAVGRLPGRASYPRGGQASPLFRLRAGEVGRWRANFRFSGYSDWYYENWMVHVSNGPVRQDGFIRSRPDFDVDDRVHLYGGAVRSGGG